MAERPLVKLLATGGTISTTTDEASGRSAPTLDAGAIAALLGDLAAGVEIRAEAVASAPSWTLQPDEMADIARRAREAAREPGVRGVVVTHGTTTLEYTAFLCDLLLDVDTPVVLTGAMHKADDAAPDGPGNLRDAVRVAVSGDARGLGALVVFAGRVIAGGRTWKARRLDVDAFVDLGGDLGSIDDGRVTITHDARAAALSRRLRTRAATAGVLEPRVALVKVVPGMREWPLATLADDVRGLVIEALPGVGGIPPGMTDTVRQIALRMPVVIASRAPFGELPPTPTGGTGEPLRDAGLLSAGPLTAEQAWLLLMVVLGSADSPTAAGADFRSALAGTDAAN